MPDPALQDPQDDAAVPPLHSPAVQAILGAPPPLACHFAEPARILPMARFMVTVVEQWVASYVRVLAALDRVVAAADAENGEAAAAQRLARRVQAELLPAYWAGTRIMVAACAGNMPQDRARLEAAVADAAGADKPRAAEQLAQFDGYMRRLARAQETAKDVEAQIEEAYEAYQEDQEEHTDAHPPDSAAREAVTAAAAAAMQFERDEKTCRDVFRRLAAEGCRCERCGAALGSQAAGGQAGAQ